MTASVPLTLSPPQEQQPICTFGHPLSLFLSREHGCCPRYLTLWHHRKRKRKRKAVQRAEGKRGKGFTLWDGIPFLMQFPWLGGKWGKGPCHIVSAQIFEYVCQQAGFLFAILSAKLLYHFEGVCTLVPKTRFTVYLKYSRPCFPLCINQYLLSDSKLSESVCSSGIPPRATSCPISIFSRSGCNLFQFMSR